jgi:hypothetical protein
MNKELVSRLSLLVPTDAFNSGLDFLTAYCNQSNANNFRQ